MARRTLATVRFGVLCATCASVVRAAWAAPMPMVWPAPGAQGVARDAQPRGAAALQLFGPLGLPVPGVLRRDAHGARFDSARPLSPCTRYTLRVGGATQHFTTACSRWQRPRQIDTRAHARQSVFGASGAQVVALGDGELVAAWSQRDHRHQSIQVSAYNPDTDSWSAPRRVDAGGSDATLPVLAAGARGAWAAWSQVRNGRDAIVVAHRRRGAWSAPRRVDGGGVLRGDATDAQLAVSGGGLVALAWQQRAAGHGAIGAAVRRNGIWGAALRLDRGAAGSYAPTLAALPDGFVAAWQRGRGAAASIVLARFAHGRWSAPQRVSVRGGAGSPTLAAAPDGGFALAWVRGGRIVVRRFDSRQRAAPARSLSGRSASDPALAFDPAGDLFAVWQQGRRRSRIVARRLDVARDRWSPVRELDAAALRSAGNPVLGVDAVGNAACAWYQDGPRGLQVHAARYDASSARWGAATRLSDARSTVQATLPALAVDSAGGFTVVWQQFNAWRDVVMVSRMP